MAMSGTVMENREPLPTVLSISIGWSRAARMRWTMDSPNPNPGAMRAPCSSRENSVKII
jgi:hypothetical protein